MKNDELTLVPPYHQAYITLVDGEGDMPFNWPEIPLIPWRYNAQEIPLIKMVKTLQDALNLMLSNFSNNMQEDARNTILILENYDGQDLGEFRMNLARYGAVKVRSTTNGTKGDVRALHIEVNPENYKAIIESLKKAIIENGMGYDAKDERMSGNPNQMNIQSMYSDIDLDANGMETEFQASMEQLLFFVDCHLANIGQSDFDSEDVEVIFNRDILINEGEAIDNINKSANILSRKTLIAQHPWVNDPDDELKKLQEEEAEAEEKLNAYTGAFQQPKDEEVADDKSGRVLAGKNATAGRVAEQPGTTEG